MLHDAIMVLSNFIPHTQLDRISFSGDMLGIVLTAVWVGTGLDGFLDQWLHHAIGIVTLISVSFSLGYKVHKAVQEWRATRKAKKAE